MHKLRLFGENKRPKILCLGAHADDIEIGCGGTILRLAHEYPEAEFRWVIFSAEGKRVDEAGRSFEVFLGNIASKSIEINAFKDSYFPSAWGAIKDCFVKLKKEVSPDLVFTHCSGDLHQDHRLIAELTWNAFRDHLIMEYEIAKYDADLGVPNLYVHLDESIVKSKVNNICTVFLSQHEKEWFGEETFRSLMRIRGLESNASSRYAEAFYCRKLVV